MKVITPGSAVISSAKKCLNLTQLSVAYNQLQCSYSYKTYKFDSAKTRWCIIFEVQDIIPVLANINLANLNS